LQQLLETLGNQQNALVLAFCANLSEIKRSGPMQLAAVVRLVLLRGGIFVFERDLFEFE
jgi:hypothetical protein